MVTYFPHPANLRTDDKVLPLRIDHGAEGYGLYLMILELIVDNPERKLKYNPKAISFALNGADMALIEAVCRSYGLFDLSDDEYLTSEWLDARMAVYDLKLAQAREAGRKGAERRWANHGKNDSDPIATPPKKRGRPKATLSQPHEKTMAIRENKTKQNKINLPHEGEGEGDFFLSVLVDQGPALTDEQVETFSRSGTEGRAPGYVAQICRDYCMGIHMYEALMAWTNGAEVKHPRYQQFCALVRTMRETNFRPSKPANYFASKLEGQR